MCMTIIAWFQEQLGAHDNEKRFFKQIVVEVSAIKSTLLKWNSNCAIFVNTSAVFCFTGYFYLVSPKK